LFLRENPLEKSQKENAWEAATQVSGLTLFFSLMEALRRSQKWHLKRKTAFLIVQRLYANSLSGTKSFNVNDEIANNNSHSYFALPDRDKSG